jgi:hypothetical protein
MAGMPKCSGDYSQNFSDRSKFKATDLKILIPAGILQSTA